MSQNLRRSRLTHGQRDLLRMALAGAITFVVALVATGRPACEPPEAPRLRPRGLRCHESSKPTFPHGLIRARCDPAS